MSKKKKTVECVVENYTSVNNNNSLSKVFQFLFYIYPFSSFFFSQFMNIFFFPIFLSVVWSLVCIFFVCLCIEYWTYLYFVVKLKIFLFAPGIFFSSLIYCVHMINVDDGKQDENGDDDYYDVVDWENEIKGK